MIIKYYCLLTMNYSRVKSRTLVQLFRMEYGTDEENNDDGASDSVVSAQERIEYQGDDAYDAYDERSIRSVALDDVGDEGKIV